DVVARALARDPADRFATAREMAESLRRAAMQTGVDATMSSVAAYVERARPPRLVSLRDRLASIESEVSRGPSGDDGPTREMTVTPAPASVASGALPSGAAPSSPAPFPEPPTIVTPPPAPRRARPDVGRPAGLDAFDEGATPR